MRQGCQVVDELHESGLNAALTMAMTKLASSDFEKVLVLPTDLPGLAREDIVQMAKGSRPAIAPDKAGTGTNALCFAMDQQPAFAFGENSAVRHLHRLHLSSGKSARVVRTSGLAFDLDTVGDFHHLSHVWRSRCEKAA